jgi:dynein heavy chain
VGIWWTHGSRKGFGPSKEVFFFSEELRSAFGGKIPKEGLCFDYFYNIQSGEYVHWQTEVPNHVPVKIGNKPGEAPFYSIFVETVESVRLMYLLNKLTRNGRQVMSAGNTGTGKTEIIKKYLNDLDKTTDGMIIKSIIMSYYTSADALKQEIEHLQHGSIFDRNDLGMRKHLVDIQYIAAMNPTDGSFEISVFGGHLETFQPIIQDLTGKIVNAAIQVHEAVSSKSLPSAVKFMYNWNMRELTNVFQGCCNATDQFYIKPEMMFHLFIHETKHMYCDHLVSEQEMEAFDILFKDIVKKTFFITAGRGPLL